MGDKTKELRIKSLEYEIRKKERGLRILFKQKTPPADIIIYGEKVEKLQDELELLTTEKYFSGGRWKVLKKGRREPDAPSWPV